MKTVIITGGTGLIGKALSSALLRKNYRVVILSRDGKTRPQSPEGLSYARWDIDAQEIDGNALATADYIIHLAGAGVADKRWSEKRKKEILESRVKSGELIVKSIREKPNHIKAVISASAIGWYGPDPSIPNPDPFREDAPAHDDFLGQTCLQWERSLDPLNEMGTRLVKLRTGIVLSNEGGALKEFKNPLRFGIASILGNGRQVISWIHIDDLVRMYIYALEQENIRGVYNAVSPGPVSNKTLVLQLAELTRGKFFIPLHVPVFALKLILGEMSIEVLKSATVSCDKAHVDGFTFLYPSIESALENLQSAKPAPEVSA